MDRFWSKVEIKGPNECWLWKGSRMSGYGMFYLNGHTIKAHRAAFELFHGRRPEKNVLHKCDNKACVNPRHLYEGDHVANARDLYIEGGGKRKLSNENVKEIKRLYRTGQYLQRELAEKFECGRPSISKILSGQVYIYVK